MNSKTLSGASQSSPIDENLNLVLNRFVQFVDFVYALTVTSHCHKLWSLFCSKLMLPNKSVLLRFDRYAYTEYLCANSARKLTKHFADLVPAKPHRTRSLRSRCLQNF